MNLDTCKDFHYLTPIAYRNRVILFSQVLQYVHNPYNPEFEFQRLDLASGLKDLLKRTGFTLESILSTGPSNISAALGIEAYVAKMIYDEAKRIRNNI